MSPLVIVLSVAAALTVGYCAGRVQPLAALDSRIRWADPKPHTIAWWARAWYCAVCGLVRHPIATCRSLVEERNGMEAIPVPPYDPSWAEKRQP